MAKKIGYVVLVLIIIVIVTGGLIAFYFISGDISNISFTTEMDNGTEEISVSGNEDITQLDITIEAFYADIDLEMDTVGSGSLFEMDWTHKYNEDNKDDTKLTVTKTSSSGVLSILIKIENAEDIFTFGNEKWDLEIAINPDLEAYGFDVDLTTGSLEMILSGIMINKLDLEATTGEIEASITDCLMSSDVILTHTTGSLIFTMKASTLSGDIAHTQTTGDSTMTIQNIILGKDTQMTLDQSTGQTTVDWTQSVALANDLIIDSESSTGTVSISMTSPSSLTRYDIKGSVSVGDFSVSGISEISENHYQSDNYDDTTKDLVKAIATASTGNVEFIINNE